MTGLEKALIEIASFLNRIKTPYMVIGGLANIFWGQPRSTFDVDITISVPEPEIAKTIKRLSGSFKVLTKVPLSFVKDTRVLPLETKNGYRIDLIFALLPYEEEAIKRATKKRVNRHWVRVCSIEDLIIHKIISTRNKDIEDVRQILSDQKKKIDRKYLEPKIKELAEILERPEIVKFYKKEMK